jgi:RNA-binding protein
MWQAYAHTVKGEKKDMITSKIRRRIKRELSSEKPTIWIGKNRATQQVIGEISRQLEKKEMVKIRMLKSALGDKEAKAIASEIAQQTGASLVDVRGHTIMLYKPRKGRREKSV